MDLDVLREQLVAQLTGGQAYAGAESIVRGFPAGFAGATSGTMRHTGWKLLEHLRIAQEDILRFTIDETYESPAWPDGYWPPTSEPPSGEAWLASVDRLLADLESVKSLVRDSRIDLFGPSPTAPARRFCARFCSLPTTMPITWVNSCSFSVHWSRSRDRSQVSC